MKTHTIKAIIVVELIEGEIITATAFKSTNAGKLAAQEMFKRRMLENEGFESDVAEAIDCGRFFNNNYAIFFVNTFK